MGLPNQLGFGFGWGWTNYNGLEVQDGQILLMQAVYHGFQSHTCAFTVTQGSGPSAALVHRYICYEYGMFSVLFVYLFVYSYISLCVYDFIHICIYVHMDMVVVIFICNRT